MPKKAAPKTTVGKKPIANSNILRSKSHNINIDDGSYKILSDGNLCLGTYSNGTCTGDILDINLEKGKPTSGVVVISDRRVTSVVNASINGKTISYDAIKNEEIVLDGIEIAEFETVSYSNRAELKFTVTNGTTYKCEYGETNRYGKVGSINSKKTQCTLKDLKPGKTYYYRFTATNSKGTSETKTGVVTTLPIVAPVITVTPTGFSSYKNVTINYTDVDLRNPKYYFYTTSQATSNIAVVECGTDFEPGECTSGTTTSLKADVWYGLDTSNSSIVIRYDINGTIIAKISDGDSTVGTNQIIITTIDNNKPFVSAKDIVYGEDAIITLRDEQSGIKYYGVTTTMEAPINTSSTPGNTLNTWYEINPTTTEEITKNFSGLDVGTYYAWGKDTLGNYESYKFTVERVKDSITTVPKTAVYTGSPIPANTATALSGTTVTYTYYSTADCTGTSISVPINAGKYSVKVSTQDSGNYYGASKCVTHTITKATPNITVNPNVVITSKNNTAIVTVSSDKNGTFKFTSGDTSVVTTSGNVTVTENQNGTETLSTHTEGETTVTVTFTPTDTTNYNTVTTTISVYVRDSIPIPTTANNCKSNLVYNGTEQILTKDVSFVNYTNNKGINAGTYTVTATLSPDAGVLWSDGTNTAKTFTCTIKPLTVTTRVTCDANKIYNGNANANNCTIVVTNTQGTDDVAISGTCTYNNANVGTNKAIACTGLTLTGNDNDNYTTTGSTATTTGNITNAKLTFDANGGTLSGTSPLYVRKGQPGVFTGLTNSTSGAIPSATKSGYTFDGWQTAANIKIINSDKSIVNGISNWTDSAGNWLITSNQTLKAIWVDKKAPTIIISHTGSALSATITDAGSGVVAYAVNNVNEALAVDSSEWISVTNTATYNLSNVSHTSGGMYVHAKDAAGNISRRYTSVVNVNLKRNATYTNTLATTVDGLTCGSSNTAYAICNLVKNENNYTLTITSKTASGEPKVRVLTSDGNVYRIYNVSVDAEAPTIVITQSGTQMGGTITDSKSGVVAYAITSTSEDALTVDSDKWINIENSPVASFTIPTTAHTSGGKYVNAKDAYGNVTRTYTSVTSIKLGKNDTYTQSYTTSTNNMTCEVEDSTLATCTLTKNETGYDVLITSKAITGNTKARIKYATGSVYRLYNITVDATAPTPTITGGEDPKVPEQTVTLKCNDNGTITAYYWGTTNPTSADLITTTTVADINALKSDSGLNKTITASGTYYLACKDDKGNFDKTTIVMRKYEVQNVLLTTSGAAGTYTSANYAVSGGTSTYYVKDGTTLTLADMYTKTAATGTFLGYTTAAPSETAQTLSNTNPTISNNTTKYYMWFNRTTFTVTLNAGTYGSLKGERVDLAGSATASAGGSNTIIVRYGEKIKATATPTAGYSFNGYSGGYISGTTNPQTGATITANKTITASWKPNIYEVTLNNQSATTAGTAKVYYEYKTTKTINNVLCYYYTTNALTTCLTDGYYITVPTKTGYTFGGYFTEENGGGTQYVSTAGAFINSIYATTGDKTLYAKWLDKTGPTITLTRQGEVNGFDGWNLGSDATLDATNQILTMNGTATTPKSPIYQVFEQNYGWSYEFYPTALASYYSSQGGSFTGTTYYDSDFNLKVGSNGYSSNGQSIPGSLNTWTTGYRANYNYGSGIEYFRMNITGSSVYSNPPTKYRNFKIYGDIYAKSKYTINVTATDAVGTVAVKKYASGSQNVAYFASNGTTFTGNSFDVTSNGTYTVYAADNSGNGSVKTITIDKIDNTAPAITTFYGKMLFTDPDFASGTNSAAVYNNSGNGTVTIERKQISGIPNSSGYGLEIKTAGTASPGLGGFVQYTNSYENAEFYHIIVAKIPVGYSIINAQNQTGNGRTITWLTPQAGTGKYETYVYKHKCGSGGTFSSFGHVYISGNAATSSNPVTWYVAYSTMIDASSYDATANYIVALAADPTAGVVSYQYTTSNSPPTSWHTVRPAKYMETTYKVTSNGTYYVWYMDAAGNIASKSTSATFKPVKVYYHPNGGTVGSSFTTCNNGWVCTNSTTYYVSTIDFGGSTDLVNHSSFGITRPGYSYPAGTEWCTQADGGGTCFNQDTAYSYATYRAAAQKDLANNYELDLYSHWKANTYTVSVDANYGTIASTSGWTIKNNGDGFHIATKSVTFDSTYGTLPSVSRPGYTFNGWYTAMSVPNITLTASSGNYNHTALKYNIAPGATYTITMGSATRTAGTATKFTTLIYDFTTNTTLASAETSFGSNISYTISCPSTADPTHKLRIIVYAGLSGSTANQAVTYSNIKVGTLGNTTSTAYTSATKVTYPGDHQLHALWTPNTLTVNYYANGATQNSSGQTVTEKLGTETLNYGATVVSAWPTDYADPYGYKLVKPGYVKDGYYHIGSGTATAKIAQDLGETTVVGVATKLGVLSTLESGNATVNIYAGWTPATYAITLDPNGGSGGTTSVSITYGTTKGNYPSITKPTRSGYTFDGYWSDRTGGTQWYDANGNSLRTFDLTGPATWYAHWTAVPTMSTCTVGGTSVTGTGTTKQAGYLVGATVTCTCTGANLSTLTINGTTPTISKNGNTWTGTYTVNTPGSANISAVCKNTSGGQATASTGTKYYYRGFTLTFNKNGATSISSTGGTQYLMANSTTGDGGHSYSSTITRTDRCGSECGVIGWGKTAGTQSKQINSGAAVNLCWSGTSGCSESISTTGGTYAVSGTKTLYAVTYGTISGQIKTRNFSNQWVAVNYLNPVNDESLGNDWNNDTRIKIIDASTVRVYNTRNYAVASAEGICNWIWSPTNTGLNEQNHVTGVNLKYYDTTISTNVQDQGAAARVNIGVYEDDGWWCDTQGSGWTITLNKGIPNAPSETVKVQYGSRQNNGGVTPPTQTGYTFLGYYDSATAGSGNVIFTSDGKLPTGMSTYWTNGYPTGVWKPAQNVTAYAQWRKHKNTLSVNPNGGSMTFNGSTISSTTSVTREYGATIAVPNPTKSSVDTSNGTLLVKFDEHSGSGVDDKTLTKKTTTTYTFKEWSNSGSGCGSMNGTTYTFSSSDGTTCTKTAQWTTSPRNWLSPGYVTLPSTSRTGYTFKGWYTASSGGDKVGGSGSMYYPDYDNSSITLHAQWTAKKYKIVFSPNYSVCSGSNCNPATPTTTTMTYGNNATVPTRSGYTFQGWYSAASGGHIVYKSDGSVNSSADEWGTWTETGNNQTLYAHWQ